MNIARTNACALIVLHVADRAYFVPERDLRAPARFAAYLPMIREVARTRETADTEFVEVRSCTDSTDQEAGGGLNIEVESEQEHVRCGAVARGLHTASC